MKRILGFALALIGAGTLASAAPRDWASVASPAPNGSYVIGNPKAKVKLVEYASYTCPHCRHFGEESAATLKGRMIRSGSTSLEIRNAVHDKLDLVAALLARCSGAANFPRFHDAVYAQQEDWVSAGADYDSANASRMRLYPQADQLKALAKGSGLTAIAQANGMTSAAVDACLADPAVLAKTLAVANATAQKINGTPAFEINGKLVENVGWAQLEPQLRAAGAK
ncbi:conserved exported hypothetical protein [Sphingomonas sp. EC-HK361]|uniref:thioredoxin domain-containing protein n=1 Tax=Sphingomonas sp. EC-HK361 TaxID=2038397 RepID=UPI00125380D1|nr:thioredoxin domain-containing protein [Sphingomonas sp. EC-HK361]VVS98281.1 conserved exported hypothetical protein [Sphingomonas sp. EC-HK361]